jgi:hypothetical protein
MRFNRRSLLLGLPVAAGVAAIAGFLQPWLAHWLEVLTWDDTFCGNADNGDEQPVYSGSLLWWAFSSVVFGMWAASAALRWRSRNAELPVRDKRFAAAVCALAAAASVGSTATIIAAHGLVEQLTVQSGGDPCVGASAFDPVILYGSATGLGAAVAMLYFREFGVALATACAIGLLTYAATAIGGLFDPTVGDMAGPFDFAEVLSLWMPFNVAQSYTWIPLLGVVAVCAAAAYRRTRDLGLAIVAASIVVCVVFCGLVVSAPG